MSRKNDYSEDKVLQWAEEKAAQYSGQENVLYPHFIELIKEYRRLLRSFHRVTRVSDGYQQALMETNETLNLAARKDPLTGLSNRRDMLDQLSGEIKRAVRYGQPVSAILIDIDHFKQVNDTYGHGAGDKVLISTAEVLSKGIRSADICARWGGEEFLICLPHTLLDDAVMVAEKLREAAAAAYVICDDKKIRITISAGVAQYKEGFLLDDLIRKTDESLYDAKRKGRNCVCMMDSAPPV